MRHSTIYRAAAALFTAVALSAAGAESTPHAPLSFKGIELGKATAEDVVAKFPRAAKRYSSSISVRGRGDEPDFQLYRLGRTSVGDFTFTELDGTIQYVDATFTAESFPAIAAALKERFGEPTKIETKTVRTRAGASFPSSEMRWLRPDGLITLYEHAGRTTSTSFTMATRKYLESATESAASSAKDAAKQF